MAESFSYRLDRNNLKVFLFSFCLISTLTTAATGDEVTIVGDKGDGQTCDSGLVNQLEAIEFRVGTGGNDTTGMAAVYFFELPTLPPNSEIAQAQLQFWNFGITPPPLAEPEFSVDLYGVDSRANSVISPDDYHDGVADEKSGTLIQKGLISKSTPYGTLSVSSQALDDFLNGLFNGDGSPKKTFAVFRINADVKLGTNLPSIPRKLKEYMNPNLASSYSPAKRNLLRGFRLSSADSSNAARRPRLSLTYFPAKNVHRHEADDALANRGGEQKIEKKLPNPVPLVNANAGPIIAANKSDLEIESALKDAFLLVQESTNVLQLAVKQTGSFKVGLMNRRRAASRKFEDLTSDSIGTGPSRPPQSVRFRIETKETQEGAYATLARFSDKELADLRAEVFRDEFSAKGRVFNNTLFVLLGLLSSEDADLWKEMDNDK